jgi:predicted AAA+ superfamily ATPase
MDINQILYDQREEILTLNTSTLCSRLEENLFDLQSNLAQVVIGVRRSGKSTLCMKVLKESGVLFGYVNFDDEQLAGLKTDQLNDVLGALYKVYGDVTHVLFDEIQNIPQWPLFVNRLLRQGLHVVMTGSNANLLSVELATHLTGRYNQIELYPFSFREY